MSDSAPESDPSRSSVKYTFIGAPTIVDIQRNLYKFLYFFNPKTC